MDQVDASGSRGDDEETFSHDIGELCTIDDDVQFIENLFDPELVVIKNEEFYSMDEEADLIECDPIEINPVNSTGVSSTQVVVKSEEVPNDEMKEDSNTEDSSKVPPLAECLNKVQQKCRQKEALEKMFSQTHYPDTSTKNHLASSLGLTYAFVQGWFMNRRQKEVRLKRKTGSKKATIRRSKDAGANTSTSGFKSRSSWSSEQLVVLERALKRHHSPSTDVFESLTKKLGVEVIRIRKWFSRRRSQLRMNTTTKKNLPPMNGRSLKSSTARQMAGPDKTSRIQLSVEQLEVLEKVFDQVRTPDQSIMEYLVEDLDLTPLVIENWFRQKRQKVKVTKIEKEIQTSKKSHCAKSQTRSQNAESEDESATDQSSASSRNLQRSSQKPNDQRHSEDPVIGSPSFSITFPVQTVLECQSLHCEVCDTIRQRVSSGICSPCHEFVKRYKKLSLVKRRIAVPPCSHKGAKVLTGCKGCRLHRYQQMTKKQGETSDAKKTLMQSESIKTASGSEQKHSSAPQDTNQIVRRSDRLSFRQFNCCFEDQKADSDEGTDDEFLGFNIPGKYPMDLQKKIHVTGKLNKLRMIASKLSNQKVMETKDRLVLSREIEGCVDDLLTLVLGSVNPSTTIKANDESMKEERGKKEEEMKREYSRPSLEKKIQSLEEVVEASASRIFGLESKLQTPVRMETSTQTDAYLLYSMENPSVIHYRPSPLPNGLPYFRNYSDNNINIQTSTAAKNSPVSTPHCLVCDQIRPRATLSHNFICTYCQTFIDNYRMVSGPNPLVPRCSHGGIQVLFGCKDCLLYRYNRVKLGMMPTIAQSEQNSSQPLYETNYGCHVPRPMNTSNKVPKTHQLTGTTNSHFTQHSIPSSYMPPRETYLNYPRSGNVQSAVSATTQLSLTLSQGGSPSEANPYQGMKSKNEEVLKTPMRRKIKKCPSVYGHSLHDLWCDGCRRRSTCTRF